jgi:magnesium chelatase subunit I
VSDLPFVLPALTGKLEFETVDDGREEQIVERLIQGAVLAVFNHYFSLGELEPTVARFKAGFAAEVSDMTVSADYAKIAKETEGLEAAIEKLGAKSTPTQLASALEFVLEGLHLNKRLNKDKVAGKYQYRG